MNTELIFIYLFAYLVGALVTTVILTVFEDQLCLTEDYIGLFSLMWPLSWFSFIPMGFGVWLFVCLV